MKSIGCIEVRDAGKYLIEMLVFGNLSGAERVRRVCGAGRVGAQPCAVLEEWAHSRVRCWQSGAQPGPGLAEKNLEISAEVRTGVQQGAYDVDKDIGLCYNFNKCAGRLFYESCGVYFCL